MQASKRAFSSRLAGALAGVMAMCAAHSVPLARADERPARPISAEAAGTVGVAKVRDDRVYYLRDGVGLVVYDVSDPDRPRFAGRHAVVGWPLGVVARDDVATIVMRGVDARSGRGSVQGSGIVRALDLRDPTRARVIGESTIEGVIRDARATESKLYVLSESRTDAATQTIVTAFRLDGSDATAPRTLRRDGGAGALRANAGRVVLARADVGKPATHLDVIEDDGAAGLTVRGSVELTLTMGREDPDVSERLDATDPARVRVLGCRTAGCDTLEVATIDTTRAARPSLVSSQALPSPGRWLATRFDGQRLYLSRRGWLGLGAPSTPIVIVDLDARVPREERAQVPSAVVWNLIPSGPRLFVVGTRGDKEVSREQVVVDAFTLRDTKGPLLDGEAVLGDGWAASPAQTSAAAIAFCGGRLAIPFRASAGTSEPRSAVAMFDGSTQGLARSREVAVPGVIERVVCVRDRLFALTDAGIWSIDAAGSAAGDVGSSVLAGRRSMDSP